MNSKYYLKKLKNELIDKVIRNKGLLLTYYLVSKQTVMSAYKFKKSIGGIPTVENPDIDQILGLMKGWSGKFTKLDCQLREYTKLFAAVDWERDDLRKEIEDQIDLMLTFVIKYDSHPADPNTPKLWRAFVKKMDNDFNEELVYIGQITPSNLHQLLSDSDHCFRLKEVFYSENGAFLAWSGGCDLWYFPNKPYHACAYLELNEVNHRFELLP